MVSEGLVQNALKSVKYPGYSRDIVSFGLVRGIEISGDRLRVSLQLSNANPEAARQIQADCEQVLKKLPGITEVAVEIGAPEAAAPAARPADPWSEQKSLPGIRRIVAVASGKGGVGKSTVAVNLACALAYMGRRVGLLDCDIYGPSVPLMMGVNHRPTVSDSEKLNPLESHGVKLMSIGFLLDGDTPVIWRGPMIVNTIKQFLSAVEWGELDYLLVDLPPGTGDAQLTLCQTVPLDGGIIVTTPQEASLGVVRKGMAMFTKVNVPILGLIENMSYYTTPDGQRVEIFGHGGGSREAERQKVEFLGEIPLFTEIREGGDKGLPVAVSQPDKPPGQAFRRIAEALRRKFND
jgi:ATP-binding protein involved in chromosome partitioning